ncbi:Uncharacterised protein [Vibrio cholerae]|nr:Uncharacterised protein [Vibrio cholerae]
MASAACEAGKSYTNAGVIWPILGSMPMLNSSCNKVSRSSSGSAISLKPSVAATCFNSRISSSSGQTPSTFKNASW